MDKQVFYKKLGEQAEILSISLNKKQKEQFYRYMILLKQWNEKINLTAIIDEEGIITKHFIDSLTILNKIPNNAKVIDVGTGAGFPGIPLAIANKNLKITLIDSLQKRVTFLQEIIKELELDNVEAIHGRAEELAKQKEKREKYDIATSRAVAKLNSLVEYLLPFVRINGKVLAMKGSNIEEEYNESKKAIEILGGKVEKICKFSLPKTDIIRNIVIIKKEKETPKKFPRKAGTPTKMPIQ